MSKYNNRKKLISDVPDTQWLLSARLRQNGLEEAKNLKFFG